MPNHVTNYISTNKKKTLEQLHESSKDLEGGLAELLMPMPQELHREGWYDWRTSSDNWGTKWGFYEQSYADYGIRAQIKFMTAWGTMSNPLFEKILKIFPDATWQYECESGWGGCMFYEKGILTNASEEWDAPNWSEGFTLEGDETTEYTYLYEDHRDSPGGWYKDWDSSEPVTCQETLAKIFEAHPHLRQRI